MDDTNDVNNEDFFPEYFDYEDVMDDQIAPLMKTIINICNEYAIPMVASFQYHNSEEDIKLCTSVCIPTLRTSGKIALAAKLLLNERTEDDE